MGPPQGHKKSPAGSYLVQLPASGPPAARPSKSPSQHWYLRHPCFVAGGGFPGTGLPAQVLAWELRRAGAWLSLARLVPFPCTLEPSSAQSRPDRSALCCRARLVSAGTFSPSAPRVAWLAEAGRQALCVVPPTPPVRHLSSTAPVPAVLMPLPLLGFWHSRKRSLYFDFYIRYWTVACCSVAFSPRPSVSPLSVQEQASFPPPVCLA